MELRALQPVDLSWFVDLNQACLPAVSSLTLERAERLIGEAGYAKLLSADEGPLGALLAFWPDADYDSPNFLWFKERYDRFLYIDRVMVDDEARGRGVGAALYADLFDFAAENRAPVTCEVNRLPPNPGSLRFHERLGFVAVGEQETDGGKKVVIMMERRA